MFFVLHDDTQGLGCCGWLFLSSGLDFDVDVDVFRRLSVYTRLYAFFLAFWSIRIYPPFALFLLVF